MIKNTANLLNLQNLMKRDPQSYLDEFRQQQRHFGANLQIFQSSLLNSGGASNGAASAASSSALSSQTGNNGVKHHKFHKDFSSLVTFLSHVSPCFPQESGQFSKQLLELLTVHYAGLEPALRKVIVQACILLQNRGLLDRMTLLPILFQLFKIQDKPLRSLLFTHIISDIKRINLKRTPGYLKINTALQNYMYTMLSDKTSSIAGKKSLDVMIDLWRRKIWNDEKTVHAIQNASFSKDTKIKVTALRFFLGMTFYEDEEEEEEEEEKNKISAKLSVQKGSLKGVVKKRKKAEREMKRAQKKMNKEDGKNTGSSVIDDCPAIFLLHDPQSYAERLFSMVRNSNEAFQVRMLIMNVISRLIGSHKLIVLNYYPFLQKYMQPHQKNVTHILTYLAQASHPLVPPDVLQPCIKTLANHFVNDRSSPEVTAVGLNAIREICARAPLVMTSELLWDLIEYKKDKNKGVMMASRSIIALFRDINPALLKRKERGKFASMEMEEMETEYGFQKVRTDVVGAELLEQINAASATGDDNILDKYGKRRKLLDADEWNLSAGGGADGSGSDEEEEDSEDEDLGTNTREINAFLRHVKKEEEEENAEEDEDMEGDEDDGEERKESKPASSKKTAAASSSSKTAKNNKRKRAAEEEEEEEEEDDDEEGEDSEGDEEMEVRYEDMEEGSDDEEDEDEEGEDDEEEEEDEDTPAPAKKRKVGSDGRSVSTSKETGQTPDEEQKQPLTEEEIRRASLPIAAQKIFTPRDFELLRQARLNTHLDSNKRGSKNSKNNSREDGSSLMLKNAHYDEEEMEDEDGTRVKQRIRKDLVGEIVSESAIVGWKKQVRKSKAERMESILTSRSDGLNSKKKGGGSTNADKAKEKPFKLTQHSSIVKAKKLRSFSQQQKAFSGHIKTMKGAGKKVKNKMKKRKSHKAKSG